MKKIHASKLLPGDVLVALDRPDDSFIILEGDEWRWSILVLTCEEEFHVQGQRYSVGCVMRDWIDKANMLSGIYDVYRGGSLVVLAR